MGGEERSGDSGSLVQRDLHWLRKLAREQRRAFWNVCCKERSPEAVSIWLTWVKCHASRYIVISLSSVHASAILGSVTGQACLDTFYLSALGPSAWHHDEWCSAVLAE